MRSTITTRGAQIFIAVFIATIGHSQKITFPFQNISLTFEERMNDLVSPLSLEEKVAQMLNSAPAIPGLGIPAYDWWNEVLAGESKTIRFNLSPEDFSVNDEDGNPVLFSGGVNVSVGGGQPGISIRTTSNVIQKMINIF